MTCKNLVSQMAPRGYGDKEVRLSCGSTSIHGQTLLCAECEAKAENDYPQGWSSAPGDICPHGNYIGDPYGPDFICDQCEVGE